MTASRVEVTSLVRLLDHVLEESASEFGRLHWHSLIRNLSTFNKTVSSPHNLIGMMRRPVIVFKIQRDQDLGVLDRVA